VIDLKQLYKNAEFVGKPADGLVFRGKAGTALGYQQSCPQFLGVMPKPFKNQGLSAIFASKDCRVRARANVHVGRQPGQVH